MNNKINKLNKFSTSKNINFKHTNYGIIKSGMYKGLQIETREFIPEKLEVRMGSNVILTTRDNLKDKKYDIINIVPARIRGLLSDFTEVVLNADNIFYRDVFLKNDGINHYVNVKKIIQNGSEPDYYITGEIFKDNRYIEIKFRYSDILEMMGGFKIIERGDTDDDMIMDEKYIYEDIKGDSDSDSDSDSEYSTGSSSSFKDFDFDLDESEETFDDIITDEMKPTISDKSRTSTTTINNKLIKKEDHDVLRFIEHILLSIIHKGKITSKLFSKKDDRIEELDKMNMVSVGKGILTILENIKDKRKRMNDVLKQIKKSITVNTIDDMFIISSVVFMNLRSSLDYKEYIDYLLKSEYFGKNVNANLTKSIVLKNTDLFSCVINKKSLDIKDIVMNIGGCFIKIIESYNETTPLSIKLQLPLQPIDYIKLKTSERKENDDIRSTILSIKDQLIYRKENSKDDSKKMLYNYLIENIDNIDNEISNLRPQVVNILSNIFSNDFKDKYELCSEKRCKEEIISNYIMMTFDRIKRDDNIVLSESDNMSLQKYIELNKIRILQNREKGLVEMDAPDYKKDELDVLNREKVKRFKDRIKKSINKRKGSSSVKKKGIDKIKIDDTDMIRYLLKDIDLNKK
jgi:hypothetical protein